MGYQIPGELLIWFALATNVVAGVGFYLAATGRKQYESLAVRSYNAFTAFVILASAFLYYLFFSDNFAFKYVYEYSSRDQSFFYTLSSFWGGQEGTYLLWLLLNALFGYVIIRKAGEYRNVAMVVYATVNLFFLMILTQLSPFALLPFAATDGLGLNPLLRDPWMVIHPPVIFTGYAMAAVPFAIVVAAMVRNKYDGVNKLIFPWVAITALMLAGGNILGGYWAYKTLGWGGYWGWDPVENSSFIPWMISLALLHGLIIEKRTGALRKTNILLTSFVFLLVVYGTFLTRSGVLGDFSVHSFTDLGVNVYLIGFMVFFVVLTIGLFAWRARSIGSAPLNYNYFGREFSLFSGMTLLFIVGVVILFWTSLPFLTTAFTSEPRAAEVSTYNGFGIPLAILISLFLTIAPLVKYRSFELKGWQSKLGIVGGISVVLGLVAYFALHSGFEFAVLFAFVATGVGMYMFYSELTRTLVIALASAVLTVVVALVLGVHSYLFLLFFASAAMAATTNVIAVARHLPGRWRTMGGQLVHFGFGVMLIGVLASSAFVNHHKVVIPLDGSREAFGMSIKYKGMQNEITYPNNRLLLQVAHGGDTTDARPQMYYSERMDGMMRKPYINRTLGADLYFSPEQIQQPEDVATVTVGKGQTRSAGAFSVRFEGFDMTSHSDTSSAMRVAAKVEILAKDTSFAVEPSVTSQTGPTGEPIMVEKPAEFTVGGDKYSMAIDRILADQGAVVLRIPELAGNNEPEQLVMEISRIPLINLVWLGTTLILLGTLLVFFRRRLELYQKAGNGTAIEQKDAGQPVRRG